MAAFGPLAGTPYFSFDRRPYREERLVAYIRREHARGRHLREILEDPYVGRCGSPSLVWSALRGTPLVRQLGRDAVEAIVAARQALSNQA